MTDDAVERIGGRDVLGREAGHVVAPEDRKPIVTEWSGFDDWINCPPNYEAWYRQYLPEAQFWVRQRGVHYAEVDNVVSEIMTRFMERDSLGVFDPSWSTRSESGRSKFRSYFSNFVVGYASGKHRNNVRYLKKHALLLDAPVGDDGTTWGELYAPVVSSETGLVDFADVVRHVRTRVNNDDLVDAVLSLALDGPVRQTALREVLGCNAKSAKSGLEAVRAALRDVYAEAVA